MLLPSACCGLEWLRCYVATRRLGAYRGDHRLERRVRCLVAQREARTCVWEQAKVVGSGLRSGGSGLWSEGRTKASSCREGTGASASASNAIVQRNASAPLRSKRAISTSSPVE